MGTLPVLRAAATVRPEGLACLVHAARPGEDGHQPAANPAILAVRLRRVKRSLARRATACLVVLAAACSSGAPSGVYPAGSDQSLPLQLQAIRGVRDGDRMLAGVFFSDSAGNTLQLDLQLAIGVPTTLQAGSYRLHREGRQESGSVRSRSVTFLGGQSDWPNLGGTFELLQDGAMKYLVRFDPTPVEP